MEFTDVKVEDVIFSLDIGTRTVIGTVGVVRDKKFRVLAEEFIEHQERAMLDGQIHDISLVAKAVKTVKDGLENKLGFKLTNVAIAAAGRFLRTTTVKAKVDTDSEKEIDKELIRGLELTAVKLAEERINKQTSGKLYCVGYSVRSYYLNGYAISNLLAHKGENMEAEVIATFLPRSVVDSLYSVMNRVGLKVSNLTLEPIAAMEAAVPQNLRLLNLALVDIGAGTSDIAICSKDTVAAYGMVSMAGDEVTETIAQNYLVDFNTAERIKREISEKEEISYLDILGLENLVSSQELIKSIYPVVEKIANEIANKVLELNGGKAPNAVFLVGGGAHTPKLKELVSKKLNIPEQRIAVKGRDAVTDCICIDNELGSTGVTVLGIALIAIKSLGSDFIDVMLNDSIVSMFNSHKHTVMDVAVQAGLSPRVLLGRNGKNVRFFLNDSKRVAFGTVSKNAKIKVNSIPANIDTEIKEGDKINIEFAQDGIDANPKIMDYVKRIQSKSFYIDDELKNIEPVFLLNEEEVSISEHIKDGDKVTTLFPDKLGLYKKYYIRKEEKLNFFIDNDLLEDDYIIKEGDRIYTSLKKELVELDPTPANEDNSLEPKHIEESASTSVEDNNNEPESEQEASNKDSSILSKDIEIVVNEDAIKLKGKSNYIFVDVFNYIEFDLTRVQGELVLTLNGGKAGFYDEIKSGDKIEIKWA
ncbi:MAG: cell division protein FtsA [Bacillota bacterium]|nr:cell division protein FtsA [Bacillota bacterium]